MKNTPTTYETSYARLQREELRSTRACVWYAGVASVLLTIASILLARSSIAEIHDGKLPYHLILCSIICQFGGLVMGSTAENAWKHARKLSATNTLKIKYAAKYVKN